MLSFSYPRATYKIKPPLVAAFSALEGRELAVDPMRVSSRLWEEDEIVNCSQYFESIATAGQI